MSDSQIDEFFNKGGMIGGGFNPKYLTYLLQIEAAKELENRLVSLGISKIIFTNKNGIDIMSEETWVTPPPTKLSGIKALQKLAEMEVNGMIEKVTPNKKENKPKEKVA